MPITSAMANKFMVDKFKKINKRELRLVSFDQNLYVPIFHFSYRQSLSMVCFGLYNRPPYVQIKVMSLLLLCPRNTNTSQLVIVSHYFKIIKKKNISCYLQGHQVTSQDCSRMK